MRTRVLSVAVPPLLLLFWRGRAYTGMYVETAESSPSDVQVRPTGSIAGLYVASVRIRARELPPAYPPRVRATAHAGDERLGAPCRVRL